MIKKIVPVILALSVVMTTAPVFAAPSDIPYSKRPAAADIDGINSAIQTFEADLKIPDNKEKVFEDYYALLHLAARNGDTNSINFLELEKINYGFESPLTRDNVTDNRYDVIMYGEDIKSAVKSALLSQYADDFRKHWGEERTRRVESFKGRPDIKVESLENTLSNKYYELLNSEADAIEFVKLLREIIKGNNSYVKGSGYDNYIDYLYASENRGFTAEEVVDYAFNVCEEYQYYVRRIINIGRGFGLFGNMDKSSFEVDDPIEALSYVRKLEGRFEEAYDYLVKNDLAVCRDDGFYRGVTYPFYSYGDASIIISGSNAMETLIHEFGHYQSFLNTEVSDEDLFFGYMYQPDMQELNSQAFELISTDFYDGIYGEDAEGMRFNKLVGMMDALSGQAYRTLVEISMYMPEFLEKMTDKEVNEMLTNSFGEKWYEACQFYFTQPGVYINYSLALFDALQIYNMYMDDNQAGVDKYLEACSIGKGSYSDVTNQLGLVSAFNENAKETLMDITNGIVEMYLKQIVNLK